MFQFSKITAEEPQYLTKKFRFEAGELSKETSANLRRGRICIVEIDKISDFSEVLTGLNSAEALLYGVPVNSDARKIVTLKMLLTNPTAGDQIARTKDHLKWPDGAGIMMLDYDPAPESPSLSREELLRVLTHAIPELVETQLIWWPSSSSHICKVDGTDLTGLRGQRIYIPVTQSDDIPRAGKILQDRLWLQGHGRIQISKSGALLERTTFDASVWQPSRLDFASGAATCDALEQRRGLPVILHPDGAEVIDTRLILPDTDNETQIALAAMKTLKRSRANREAVKIREQWLTTRRKEELSELSDNAPEETAQTLRLALDTQTLGPDFVIFVQRSGDDKFEPITVRNILRDRLKFDGCVTLDPLEPSYSDQRQVGKLFLSEKRPVLHSFARGGTTWKFASIQRPLVVHPGKMGHATEQVLELMRSDGRFFDYGSDLVTIENHAIQPLDEFTLELMLVREVQFMAPIKGDSLKPIDPPSRLLRHILSLGSGRGLKPLRALSNAPSVREDGSLLLMPGYDSRTGIYQDYETGDFPNIPMQPSRQDALGALEKIWAPFSRFPFADAASRGAFLAAILTSIIRPSLPTAPMFHSDAPVFGSGKTLALEALGLLSTGKQVSMTPPPRAGDESEMRKMLTSFALPGNDGVLFFDNCVGRLASGALCAFLTGESWKDRVLGASRLTGGLPTRIFIAASGTNLTFSGDLNRRVIQWRIDPRTEVAFEREFDFCPKEVIKESRPQIIAASLTLIRAAIAADLPKPSGRLASFDVWDRLVRNSVRYVAIELQPGFYADPVEGLRQRTVSDDDAIEVHDLLEALYKEFGSDWFKAREISDKINSLGGGSDLADAFSEIVRSNASISSKSAGRHLTSMLDRIVGGLVLRSRASGQSRDWRIESLRSGPPIISGETG